MNFARRFFLLSLVALAALAACIVAKPAGAAAPAAAYTLQKASDPVPAECAAAVSATLGADALKVMGPNGMLCELWLRKAVPAADKTDNEIGVTFGQITQGTFIGVIQFPADVI